MRIKAGAGGTASDTVTITGELGKRIYLNKVWFTTNAATTAEKIVVVDGSKAGATTTVFAVEDRRLDFDIISIPMTSAPYDKSLVSTVTNASADVTSVTLFTPAMLGASVSVDNRYYPNVTIPAGTTVSVYTSTSAMTLSNPVTVTGTSPTTVPLRIQYANDCVITITTTSGTSLKGYAVYEVGP